MTEERKNCDETESKIVESFINGLSARLSDDKIRTIITSQYNSSMNTFSVFVSVVIKDDNYESNYVNGVSATVSKLVIHELAIHGFETKYIKVSSNNVEIEVQNK
jgi:hypothetical protein